MAEPSTSKRFTQSSINVGVIVTVVIFIVVHGGGLVWFASGINHRVDYAVTKLNELSIDVKEITRRQSQYDVLTQMVSRVDRDLSDHLRDKTIHTRKLSELESRIKVLESKVNP